MEIVVQLNQEVAAELTRRQETGPAHPLPEMEHLGLSLKPMHPGESDPVLATYFTVEVPDTAAADEAIGALRDNDAVEAAYVKPAVEPP